MTEALPSFEIVARLKLIVSTNVVAKDLTEASAKAQTLREKDFVKIKGEYLDGNIEIVGVTVKDGWNTD